MRRWVAWAAILTALVAGYVAGRGCTAAVDAETANWLDSTRIRDSLLERVRRVAEEDRAAALLEADRARRATAGRRASDSALARARSAADSVPILIAQRDSSDSASVGWQRAFVRVTVALDTALARGDSAVAQLGRATDLLRRARSRPCGVIVSAGVNVLPELRTSLAHVGVGCAFRLRLPQLVRIP